MKIVSILVPFSAVPAAIVDPQYMFSAVNMFFEQAGHQPFFKVQLVGASKEVALNNGMVKFTPDLLLEEVGHTDLIVIPALFGNMENAVAENAAFLPWINSHYQKGAEVASLCVGAFLLASTGLLANKSCSTHWLFANEFKNKFPDINFEADRVVTDQDGLYTSGGAHAYWNLLLYLVEKYTTKEMAVMASKFFLLDIDKQSQLPFSMFKGQRQHGDELVLGIQKYMEGHFEAKHTVDDLAEQFHVGRRTLERRFKKATGNTMIEYSQRVKIEVAKRQLEEGVKTVNEVMYHVGYTDPKAFRDVFKKFTSISPVDYKKRYNKEIIFN